MHDAAFRFIAHYAATVPPGARVLEIGSHNINGSVRPLFAHCLFTGLDVVDGPGVDVVADGATYRHVEPVDVVVCCEVLEHAQGAAAIVDNALTQLAPLGLFLMTCAGEGRAPHSAVDGGPLRAGEFYRNVTREAWLQWVVSARTDVAIETDTVVNREACDLYAYVRRLSETETEAAQARLDRCERRVSERYVHGAGSAW